ncbi:MAG: virulence factor, partial [bacterium]
LVCMMAEGAGFEVYDIGVDQSVEKFMAAADRVNPKIIGMSALLTTTMTYMKTVIDGFEAAGRGEIKMAIGGAPISQMFADEIGADGYGQNASAAVDLFLRLASGKDAEATLPAVAPRERNVPSPTAIGKRSTYKILYWQEVPSQVRAEDDAGNDVSMELPPKFALRIDALAQKRGITGADAYTAEWKWSDDEERDGSAHDVALAVIAELEAKANW